jgi:hypothetical protein
MSDANYFNPPDKTTWIEGRVKSAPKKIITNREAHEKASGYGLCPEFFAINGIDPDAPFEGRP